MMLVFLLSGCTFFCRLMLLSEQMTERSLWESKSEREKGKQMNASIFIGNQSIFIAKFCYHTEFILTWIIISVKTIHTRTLLHGHSIQAHAHKHTHLQPYTHSFNEISLTAYNNNDNNILNSKRRCVNAKTCTEFVCTLCTQKNRMKHQK